MAVNKEYCFGLAIDIIKNYASSNNHETTIDIAFQRIYDKIKELQQDVEKRD